MSYYTDYLKKLLLICDKKKIHIKKIGKIHNFPMYKIIINPKAKKAVCFSAGIHGDEIASSWAILKFLEEYDSSKFPDIKIIIFPVASPTAFNMKKRYNYLNKELNGRFCDKRLTGENKILLSSLKKEKILFFHSLHEDVDEKRFYLYNFEKKEEKIYRGIIKLAKTFFPINNSRKIYKDPAVNGMIINRQDGSFEDRLFRDGAIYSMCTETPGKQSIKKRVELSVAIMKLVINFIHDRY